MVIDPSEAPSQTRSALLAASIFARISAPSSTVKSTGVVVHLFPELRCTGGESECGEVGGCIQLTKHENVIRNAINMQQFAHCMIFHS